MIQWLQERNIIFIEQPLPKKQLEETAWLRDQISVPLIADEAVQRINDIPKIKDFYSGINIKLMKCTGMREAYNMANYAKALGMKILIGSMNESSCAISAAAQITPLANWVDLDGPFLIKNDPYKKVVLADGKIVLNDLPRYRIK